MVIATFNIQYDVTQNFYGFYSINTASVSAGTEIFKQLISITQTDQPSEFIPGTNNYQIFEGALENNQFGVYGMVDAVREYNQSGELLYETTGMSMQLLEFRNQQTGADPIAFSSQLFSSNDLITGSQFADTILGFANNDTLYGSASASATDTGDILLGNGGSDIIYGYQGNDSIVGGSGLVDALDSADTLYGGAGDDDIYGSAGGDKLYGEEGNDLLVAGADNDTVTGGAGNDIFVHVLGGGKDVILDMTTADIITIERTDIIQSYADILTYGQSDAFGSYIQLSADYANAIYIANFDISTLSEANFFFYG